MNQPDGRALMSAIGGELAEVRAMVDDLSALASEMITRFPAQLRAEAITRAQAFDLVIQRLDVLSALMVDVGSGTPPDTALQAVSLSDIANRLTGREADAPKRSRDLVLFD